MKIDTSPNNPDLAGFDLAGMKDLGAYTDGSGGGIWQLAWETMRLRETQERINRLKAFIVKHQLVLARLDWSCDVDSIPPVKSEDRLFVCQISLSARAFDKQQKVTAANIIALWPNAQWHRSKPAYYSPEDTERDYTAEIDGVVIRIKGAERRPAPVKIDPFESCGPLRS